MSPMHFGPPGVPGSPVLLSGAPGGLCLCSTAPSRLQPMPCCRRPTVPFDSPLSPATFGPSPLSPMHFSPLGVPWSPVLLSGGRPAACGAAAVPALPPAMPPAMPMPPLSLPLPPAAPAPTSRPRRRTQAAAAAGRSHHLSSAGAGWVLTSLPRLPCPASIGYTHPSMLHSPDRAFAHRCRCLPPAHEVHPPPRCSLLQLI